MLTLEDCIALSELRPDEIKAIAEIEHLPEMIAAELGYYLMHLPDGERRVQALLRADLEAARRNGDFKHAAKLRLCLERFLAEHPSGTDSGTP
jgi:hypothetical protein